MKKGIGILLAVILTGALGGYIYWQFNKKQIVRDSIKDALVKTTDSLYYIHYDSSFIDEVNGNATFYNVVLQSDSAQKVLLNSTDSLPNALYNIRIAQVEVRGADISGFLQKENISAQKIILLKPVIQIIHTGTDQPKSLTENDTLALYQKILGKFKSIQANTIQVTNGTLLVVNKTGKVHTAIENFNVTLSDFLVDKTKNYQSIISYFLKDVVVSVENIQLPFSKSGSRVNLEKVEYNAAKRYLHIAAISQYQPGNMNPVTDLKNIQVNELNTDAFIIQQRLKGGQITSDGGIITIYVKKDSAKAKTGDRSIELSTDIIDQAQIAGINLGGTKVIIIDRDHPEKPPFILNNVRFKVTKVLKINEATTFHNLVNNSAWEMSANGFSFRTKDNQYKLSVGDFSVSNTTSTIHVKNILLAPLLSEKEFVKRSSSQKPLYNLTFNNVILSGVNTKRFLSNQELEMDKASFQLILKIFKDRTLAEDSINKVGKYPHQSLLKLPFPFYVKTIKINNSAVYYKEKSFLTKKTGTVFFDEVNATLSNVTNLPGQIKLNDLLKANITARFLGAGSLSTEWYLPLHSGNEVFKINGVLGKMNAVTINSVTEPLGMVSIKEGQIDELNFSINGTDTKATGNILFLYRDIKFDILKRGDDEEMKKKGLLSLLANALMKNENIKRENTQVVNYERDIYKSFFNLLWQTIFTGVKNTVK